MGFALPFSPPEPEVSARGWRSASKRQRAGGLAAALLVEALVVIALLTLGTRRMAEMDGGSQPISVFDVASPEPDVAAPAEPVKARETEVAEPVPRPPKTPVAVTPQPVAPAPPRPSEQPVPLVKLEPAAPSSALPSRPSRPAGPPRVYGPPAPSSSSAPDTPLVEGSGPNGEKLYAAAWQREPYDSELKGYLSTATGPGWGLIACRTVPDYRVEDCVALGESPRGSQIARAVLAAAWQFRVRPPRVGGQLQVGEWVRIRIDYGIRQRNSWERD
jgi:protein TonB